MQVISEFIKAGFCGTCSPYRNRKGEDTCHFTDGLYAMARRHDSPQTIVQLPLRS